MKEKIIGFYELNEMLYGDVVANDRLIDVMHLLVNRGLITSEDAIALYDEIVGDE